MYRFSVNDYFIEKMHILNVTKEKKLILRKNKFLLDANLIQLQHKSTLSTLTKPGRKYDFSKMGNNILSTSLFKISEHTR
jgi:hypothetical protein